MTTPTMTSNVQEEQRNLDIRAVLTDKEAVCGLEN